MIEVVKGILRSKNKVDLNIHDLGTSKLIRFGVGKLSDLLSFGFSFIEHEDHFVSYVLVSPSMAKKIVQEIDTFYFTAETQHIGMLWTAQLIVTDRVGDLNILFSNADYSVVLALNTNKIEQE